MPERELRKAGTIGGDGRVSVFGKSLICVNRGWHWVRRKGL
ncbi:hypothetical protein [Thalassospira sp. MCCC 1A01428]|nr:hypothetical protein [Thalassospira sp. MCCC 1A01428]